MPLSVGVGGELQDLTAICHFDRVCIQGERTEGWWTLASQAHAGMRTAGHPLKWVRTHRSAAVALGRIARREALASGILRSSVKNATLATLRRSGIRRLKSTTLGLVDMWDEKPAVA